MRGGGFSGDRLLEMYARVADAPDAVALLRRFVLDLAVRGKLVEQDPADEPVVFDALMKGSARSSARNDVRVDQPYPLPLSWRWTEIGDQLDLLNGMAFKPSDWQSNGLPIVRIQNLNREDASFNYCDPKFARERSKIDSGSFLISWSGTPGTSFGAFIWQRGPAVLNQHIFRCDFKTENFQSHFLRLAVNGRLDEMIEKAHGGVGLQHITKGKLEAMLIPLPPLAEQHRIVARVEELMALCDRLEAGRTRREGVRDRLTTAALARLTAPDGPPEVARAHARFALDTLPALTTRPAQIKTLRQTILNLAVRGKLVEQDPTDEPAAELLKRIATTKAHRVKTGQIPRKADPVRDPVWGQGGCPAGWSHIALGQVTDIVTSGSRGWGEFYSTTGPGFVRAQNIRFGRLRLDDLACVNPPSNSEGSRTQVVRDDLLIVITGAGVTNPALLDRDLGEAYVSQHVGLVRPTDTALSPWLLHCLLADAGGRAELVERAYGAGKPGLNLDNIRNLTIPLPPLAEQHRIVAKVDALMTLCDRLEADLAGAAATRRCLLDALLHEALAPADLHEREAAE